MSRRAGVATALPALLALMMSALLAMPAAAHRGHASLAVIEIDAKSGVVDVTHRFSAHDVEPALVAIAPDADPSLDDPDAMKALVAYVLARFRIDGLVLVPAGQKLAGDDLVLHFVGRLKGRPRQLRLAGALFGETWDDHDTMVNIRRAGVTRTLHFRPGDPPAVVPLSDR